MESKEVKQTKISALKARAVINDFIDKSLRNGYFNKLVDYNQLHAIADHLKFLSTVKPDR